MKNILIYSIFGLSGWLIGDVIASIISGLAPTPLIQILALFAVFFAVSYAAYWITEVKGLPQWLQYKPFECRLCLTFWSLITIYTTIWLSFHCLYIGIGGIMLAILNALAMWIDQKNKTVKIENYDDFEPHDIPTSDEPINIEIKGDEIIINKSNDK